MHRVSCWLPIHGNILCRDHVPARKVIVPSRITLYIFPNERLGWIIRKGYGFFADGRLAGFYGRAPLVGSENARCALLE